MSETNKNNLLAIDETITFAINETKAINHRLNGKKLIRKWVSVFLMFGAWTILQLGFSDLANDFLILLTVLGGSFGIVYLIFKPLLAKQKREEFDSLVNQLKPQFTPIVQSMNDRFSDSSLEQQDIYLVDGERIDLNQNATHKDLLARQLYVHIVSSLQREDQDSVLDASKYCVHILSDIPYHEL